MGFVSGCDDCGLVFSNPRPSSADLERLYTPQGDFKAAPSRERTEPRGRSWARPFAPMKEVLNVMAPPAGAAVLDFGCGAGRLLDAFQDYGWSTFGIEPSTDEAFRKHRRLDSVPPDPTFDLIVAYHVLEHLPDPLDPLKRFAAAARPGAFLFVAVPRFDTLPAHRDYNYVLNGHAHVTAFTWACLHTLLARAGWMPIAEPPDEVSHGGGRRTRSRLRVLARRSESPVVAPEAPAQAARAAIREYYAASGRPYSHHFGIRVAARRMEAQRRQALRAAKLTRAREVSPQP